MLFFGRRRNKPATPVTLKKVVEGAAEGAGDEKEEKEEEDEEAAFFSSPAAHGSTTTEEQGRKNHQHHHHHHHRRKGAAGKKKKVASARAISTSTRNDADTAKSSSCEECVVSSCSYVTESECFKAKGSWQSTSRVSSRASLLNQLFQDDPLEWPAEKRRRAHQLRAEAVKLRREICREHLEKGHTVALFQYELHLVRLVVKDMTDSGIIRGEAFLAKLLKSISNHSDRRMPPEQRKLSDRLFAAQKAYDETPRTAGLVVRLEDRPETPVLGSLLANIELMEIEGQQIIHTFIHKWGATQSKVEKEGFQNAFLACIILGYQMTDSYDSSGRTPLLLALDLGATVFVHMLLQNGFDYELQTADHVEPMLFLVQLGSSLNRHAHAELAANRMECFRCLLRRSRQDGRLARIAPRRSEGYNVLHYCAVHSTLDMLELALLLDEFRDPRVLDAPSNTSTSGKKHLIDMRLVEGQTPLHKAIIYKNTSACKALLEAGAKANTIDARGYSPLHTAVTHSSVDVVKLLLQHGASPLTKDSNGLTVGDYCANGRSSMNRSSLNLAVRMYCSRRSKSAYILESDNEEASDTNLGLHSNKTPPIPKKLKDVGHNFALGL